MTTNPLHLALLQILLPAIFLLASSALPIPTLAQEPEQDSPSIIPDYKSGELKKGETLVSALKREGLNGDSIREATQSLSKIFDFRLSRSGDKFEYSTTSNKRIDTLRYHRASFTYEAKLLDNTYQSHIATKRDTPKTPQNNILPPSPTPDPGPTTVAQDTDPHPPAPATDPPLPVDPALVGIPSPDDETTTTLAPNNMPQRDNTNTLDPASIAPPNTAEDSLEPAQAPIPQPGSPQNSAIVPPTEPNHLSNNTYNTHTTARKWTNNTRLLTPLFISSLILFLLAITFFALPRLLLKMRMKNAQLKLNSLLPITQNQQIASINLNNSLSLIIAINPNKLIPLACVPNELAHNTIKDVQIKTFWNKMAEKPLNDAELKQLIEKPRQNQLAPDNTEDNALQEDLDD